MANPKLTVTKRTVLGKKIKKLRKEGILPANIYGKDLASTAVQVPLTDFQKLFKEVGETGLVDVQLDGSTRPVLIKNLHMDYEYNVPLHADFFQVNLKEKVKTMVPLVIEGEANAVSEKIGLLLQPITEVEVEALPSDLPENITVNVEPLAAIDEQIMVSDLKIPAGVTILTDAAQVVAKIAELVSKETQADEAAAEAAKTEDAEDAAVEKTEENAEAGDGAKPTEEKPQEDKK